MPGIFIWMTHYFIIIIINVSSIGRIASLHHVFFLQYCCCFRVSVKFRKSYLWYNLLVCQKLAIPPRCEYLRFHDVFCQNIDILWYPIFAIDFFRYFTDRQNKDFFSCFYLFLLFKFFFKVELSIYKYILCFIFHLVILTKKNYISSACCVRF